MEMACSIPGLVKHLRTYMEVCGTCSPAPSTPMLQNEAILHDFYCSVRASTFRAQAAVTHRSVLDQMVAKFREHLGEDTVICVGGGYLGQRALRHAERTPVLQLVLKQLSLYFRIVIVDEVSQGGRRKGPNHAPPLHTPRTPPP
jgi:hypothetical protein